MKAFLLSILVFTFSGCEIWVEPYNSHYDNHVTVNEPAYDPNYLDYPYDVEPEACYYHKGATFCEWVHYDYMYTECIETWYFDEYWRLWEFYNEECYAI